MRLIDSNVLVYAHNADSPHQSMAMKTISDAMLNKFQACFSIQNLLEFYCVITNPKRVQKPLNPNQASRIVHFYQTSPGIKILRPSINTLAETIKLAAEYKITKAEVFDTFLVATMYENNIREIYTGDSQHFEKFSNIRIINPFYK